MDTTEDIPRFGYVTCAALTDVWLPASVTELGSDIFVQSPRVVVHTPAGSAAAGYCSLNGVDVVTE